MQVIFTHEQTDFDALASMLGAYFLQKDAYVVLPHALNRNVQAFLHLYGADLPFITIEELPGQPIDTLTLVDTQSLVTLKGMKKNTQVYVIDHHKQKDDFPENWHFTSVETIACTTHFVENLQEINGNLSMIQATLLLLGIYEDSGSLSYAHTTPQDVMAVAFLLENGASLRIANNFLNPPLSEEQHKVFEELLDRIESITLQNCRIMLSCANAPRLEDEVSSIAHKIRDLLDPDALFIFVRGKEGIRLVARSITDQINVAEIARQYNGGGHVRAASALLQHNKDNPNQLQKELNLFKQKLPEFVQPAITVNQIMSKKPLTIHLDTTAQQAFQLMQQFGYEGYPVVEDDKVRGLLTRRAVDRALAHKLDLTAASLMEAGSFSVEPDDSLEKLHQIMAESGWGQVPVVNPKNSQIIGIATRTDLLKVLAGRSQGSVERRNLSAGMKNTLPPPRFALLRLISQAAEDLQLPIFLVGGFARDLLLKTPSFDLDFVVEGDAILLAEHLAQQFGGGITSHRKFGTAKWRLDAGCAALKAALQTEAAAQIEDLPASIDLISARTEFYDKPSALPIVKKSSIKLDLHRRDFSINTMAVRLDGQHFGDLYDYWGGLNDLKNKNIRVLHSLSFVDDPTRMLRAVRFEQRFAFSIEPRTLLLLQEARSLLQSVSGERIRHELDLMIAEEELPKMMARLQELQLLPHIHPALKWNSKIAAQVAELRQSPLPSEWKFASKPSETVQKAQAVYILLLAELPRQEMEAVCQRLRLKNHLRMQLRLVNRLLPHLEEFPQQAPSQIAARLKDCPPLAAYCLYLKSSDEAVRVRLRDFATLWRWIKPITDGVRLKEMGVPIGPQIGSLLGTLKAAWIDGQVSSAAQEAALLQKLLKKTVAK